MKNFRKVYFLFIVLNVSVLYAQEQKDVVAKAGDIIITKKEFRERYEFTPHIRTKTAHDSATTKRDFLYTLIAEKLLAQSAYKEGLGRSSEFKNMMNYLKNIYLRDALYKTEVKNKVVIPDSEIVKGKNRILKTLRVKFIFSTDETGINNLYSELKNGASFDSLLATRPENDEQKDTAEVHFGTMNEKIENVLFDLFPNQYTIPVRLAEGWYICKVYSVKTKPGLDSKDIDEVKKVISSRIEDKVFQEFHKTFFNGKKVLTDLKLFNSLSKYIFEYLKENAEEFKEKRSNKLRLDERDVVVIRKKFTPQELNSSFVKFQKDPVTLSEFLNYFLLQGFEAEQMNESVISSKLKSYVRNYIEDEMIAREALKRGYDKSAEVQTDLNLWKDFYLSNEEMTKVFKSESVNDDEAYNFFVKNSQVIEQPEQVKISEILLTDLNTVEKVLREIDNGTDFKLLAEKYTLRDSLRSRGGEFNYFPVSENGELGKAAKQMKVGDVYGPIKTSEGYSIIKLLDKKEGKKVQYNDFKEASSDIKNILRTRKMYKKLDDLTGKLAIENGIEINDKALNSINVTNINMIVFRRFGFGGQLTAVPLSTDFSSWYKSYIQLKNKQLP